MAKNDELMDVIKAINQIAADSFDGAEIYGKEEPKGMKRSEGDWILDSRVIDGFNVRIQGNQLILSYQSDVKLEQMAQDSFKKDVVRQVDEVEKWLKKEFKKMTGKSLTLKSDMDEPNMMVQSASSVRAFVIAEKIYTIGNIKLEESKKFDFTSTLREWREQGKKQTLDNYIENGSYWEQIWESLEGEQESN